VARPAIEALTGPETSLRESEIPMSKITPLAESQADHTKIRIELGERGGTAIVKITWPTEPSVVGAVKFPELAASLTTLFANASMELARVKAGKRL
jgi:hypothetical protein